MTNIAIIEDNPHFRQTLSIILHLEKNFRLIHKLSDCSSMMQLFEEQKPDVVIMDMNLPGMNGIEGVSVLKSHWPGMKVLMLTVFEDEEKIFGAVKAGADSYLLKTESPQKIINAIKTLSNGEFLMNSVVAFKMLKYFHEYEKENNHSPIKTSLASKEEEILQLFARGFSYDEIAERCCMSIPALSSHVSDAYLKLKKFSKQIN